MSTSVFLLLVFERLLVDCAPKLGHVLFDPLTFEADKNINGVPELKDQVFSDDDFLENDSDKQTTTKLPTTLTEKITLQSRRNLETTPKSLPENTSTTKRLEKFLRRDDEGKQNGDSIASFGYDFDQTICKEINTDKRILCGYNKNSGQIPKEHAIIQMENGCVIRGDRIECGYVKGGIKSKSQLRLRAIFPTRSNKSPEKINFVAQIQETSSIAATFPKVSTLPFSSSKSQIKISTGSEPTHTYKVTENSKPTSDLTLKITLKEVSLPKRELTSGKMTTTLLTSRSGSSTPKMTANSGRDAEVTQIKVNPQTLTSPHSEYIKSSKINGEVITSQIPVKTSVSNLEMQTQRTNQKSVLRNDEFTEAVSQITKGCTSCVLKSFMKNQLRNSDGSDNSADTKKNVTRCVEIGDRIVCYPVKNKTTVAL